MTASPTATPRRRPRTDRHGVAVGLPRWLWIPAGIGFALIALPVVGLVVRADLVRFPELVTSEAALSALELSLRTALTSTLLCQRSPGWRSCGR